VSCYYPRLAGRGVHDQHQVEQRDDEGLDFVLAFFGAAWGS
jgi:hypothetical protein